MAYWSRRRPRPNPNVPTIINRQPQTAAVQAIGPRWNQAASRTRQAWQERAEWHCENLGLVRFANGLLASAGARCNLLVEKLVDPMGDEWEPIDEEQDAIPAAVLRQYQGPFAETPGDLVAAQIWAYKGRGEVYLTVDANPEGGLDWAIRSVRSVQFRTHDVLVLDLPGGSVSDGTAHVLPREQVVRLWQPDPTWPLLATSHMKAVIRDCDRYEALARRIKREAESVLTNGLLFTPGYAHVERRPTDGLSPGQRQLSQFDEDLYRTAEMAWGDDDSVAAIAALSVHYDGPNQTRDPMPPQYIHSGRELDPNGIAYREEAAENIARGLDLPTQLALSGQGGTKPGTGGHFSAWLMSEDFVKTAVAPTMDKVTHADLTAAMFRPTLRKLATQGAWNGDPQQYRVGYDPTPIIVHPDRGATAITLAGLGLIRSLPVLEANGFDASDAPDDAELAKILTVLQSIHARPGLGQTDPGPIRLDTPASPAAPGATGPSTVRELPPGSPTMAALSAALSPYKCEVDQWLEEPVSA